MVNIKISQLGCQLNPGSGIWVGSGQMKVEKSLINDKPRSLQTL
jgi:hypothetical protein